MTPIRRALFAATVHDARAYGSPPGPCGEVAVWRGPVEGMEAHAGTRVLALEEIADPRALWGPAMAEAGEVVGRLVESGWWRVDSVDVARLLRDLVVRELAEHIRALMQVEAAFEELGPDEVSVPLPLRQPHYVADGMFAESVRLVAGRRGIGFQYVGGGLRRARAAIESLKWRFGLRLTRDRYLRKALLVDETAGPPSAVGSQKTVLVGPCWGAELQAHTPVSNLLRKRGWRIVPFEIPFYYTREDWRGDTLPEPVNRLGQWGGRPAFELARLAPQVLLRRFRDRAERQRHHSLFEARGVNLLGSVYTHARLTRLLTVESSLAVGMRLVGAMACEAVEPTVLLTVKAEGPEVRGLMTAAQAASVPVVFVPHGVVHGDPRWDDIIADRVLADGQSFADTFIRRTRRNEDVRVIGTPKHDPFLQQAATGRADPSRVAERRRALGPDAHALWIGVATTDCTEADLRTAGAVATFAREHGDCGILVKTHPRLSQGELMRRFIRAAGATGRIVAQGSVMEVLGACDVVVTGVSTAAIEAMAVGRPVVYVGSVHDEFHGYVTAGAALHVETADELPAALGDLLGNEGQRQALIERGLSFAEHKLGPLDGHAAERAVAEIERLASRRSGVAHGEAATGSDRS